MNKPNILAVCYRFDSGGAETLATTIIENLKSNDCNISTCATNSLVGNMKTQLEKQDIPCYGLDFDNKNKISRFFAVYKLLKKLKVNILYIQHFTMFTHFYWPAKLLGVERIVVTEHSNKSYINDKKLVHLVRKRASVIDAITLVHKRIHGFFSEQLSYPKNKIEVIPNGIDTNKFIPDRSDFSSTDFGISDHHFVIGCVARLHELKDHQNLLHAISHIKLNPNISSDNLRVLLVGDGELRGQLENLSTELNIDEHLIFLGDRSDVYKILPLFDLFVLPSKSEGFPIVLLEAMSCEVPCIATDVGGISILFEKGGGEVVPAQNPLALAEAITRTLVLSDSDYKYLCKQARQIILADYQDTKMLNAYKKVILGNYDHA